MGWVGCPVHGSLGGGKCRVKKSGSAGNSSLIGMGHRPVHVEFGNGDGVLLAYYGQDLRLLHLDLAFSSDRSRVTLGSSRPCMTLYF